ncbi:MAG: glycosyltransferase family 2 protein [Phycisphaerales bacterium]
MISVVIPTYNRAARITPTLRSVLDQIGPADEVIVVDDGGSDNTAQVVRSLDGRITYIRQENGGPGTARNTGIAAAKGDYIALLDSDDLWLPWTRGLAEELIRRHDNPAMIAGEYVVFEKLSEVEGVRREELAAKPYPTILEVFRDRSALLVTGAFFRADVLKNSGGFVTERINAEDGDLILRIAHTGAMVMVKSPMMFAFGREGGDKRDGLSLNVDKTYRGMRMLLEREAAGMYGGGSGRALRRNYIAGSIRAAVMSMMLIGARSEPWDLYRRTLVMNLQSLRVRFVLGAPLMLLTRRVKDGLSKSANVRVGPVGDRSRGVPNRE